MDEHPCPCQWDSWSTWTSCSVTCGGGIRNRVRSIKREATNGGEQCHGKKDEQENCSENPCPVDCVWAEWELWSSCPACLEVQNKTRLRKFEIEAEHDGKQCDGNDFEYEECTLEEELKKQLKHAKDQVKNLEDQKKAMEEKHKELKDENEKLEKEKQQCQDELTSTPKEEKGTDNYSEKKNYKCGEYVKYGYASLEDAKEGCNSLGDDCQGVQDYNMGDEFTGEFALCGIEDLVVDKRGWSVHVKESWTPRTDPKDKGKLDGKFDCPPMNQLLTIADVTLNEAKQRCLETPNCQAVLDAHTDFGGGAPLGTFVLCRSYPVPRDDGMNAYITEANQKPRTVNYSEKKNSAGCFGDWINEDYIYDFEEAKEKCNSLGDKCQGIQDYYGMNFALCEELDVNGGGYYVHVKG